MVTAVQSLFSYDHNVCLPASYRRVDTLHGCLVWVLLLDIVTSSPKLVLGASPSHEEAFLLRRGLPGLAFTAPGLTASPQAATVSPTARMFFAALISRSWTTPHSGHAHDRTS